LGVTDRATALEVFAKTVRVLAPYSDEIVFIGGWVHALYLAEGNEGHRAVFTDDIDVTIPLSLLTAGRPTLLELAGGAGFDIVAERDDAPVRVVQYGPDGEPIDLDILTEHSNPREAVPIEGQPDLLAQGYPGQRLLLENARVIDVGPEIHLSLTPPQRIRIPTIGSYVLQKVVSSRSRVMIPKAVKDLVYAHEILRHPRLGDQARAELRELSKRYPDLARICQERIEEVIHRDVLRQEMAEQLVLAGRAFGDLGEIKAQIAAQFRRANAEVFR
jgi:hypothetical protein